MICLIGCYFVVWLWKKHFQLIQCLEYWVDCRPFELHFWRYGIAIRPLKAKAMNAFKKFMVILNSVICFDRKRGALKRLTQIWLLSFGAAFARGLALQVLTVEKPRDIWQLRCHLKMIKQKCFCCTWAIVSFRQRIFSFVLEIHHFWAPYFFSLHNSQSFST